MFKVESVDPYIVLCKPRIVGMVIVVTALGYLLAGGDPFLSPIHLIATVIGTVMTGAGASALNQYIERESDALMKRTAGRPLPTGVLNPDNALYFGLALVLSGVGLLVFQVNLLTGFLALLTAFLYVLVYTPLKKVTWLNTLVGAVPGAIPPVGGWTAVTGNIDSGAILLFVILFVWQIPHFYAIAWMYKDDYARGGYKMLPVVDTSGKRTFEQIVQHCHLLILVSFFPAWLGLTGFSYMIGVVIAGGYFLIRSLEFTGQPSYARARAVVVASLIYLPTLLFTALI